MTACLKCGHDPSARVVGSWSTDIPLEIQSGNSRIVNASVSRWKYADARKKWEWAFRSFRINQHIPRALTKRRVTITRYYDGRQRELDADNFATGAKLVLDAMVREGLLVDDRREFAEVHYEQVRQSPRRTVVLLEEFDAPEAGSSDGADGGHSKSSEVHTERSRFVRESDVSDLTAGSEQG